MNIYDNNSIIGLPQGVLHGNYDRVDELNDRVYSRHIPDMQLEPNFDMRPVPTKYSHFPVLNLRPKYNQRIYHTINHNVTTNFNPTNRNAPPYGYLMNIDTETMLRNQTVALQHGADQGVYVPSSNSELYKTSVPVSSIREPQPFPNLFGQMNFSNSIHPNLQNSNIGTDRLFNHTRTQLRNS